MQNETESQIKELRSAYIAMAEVLAVMLRTQSTLSALTLPVLPDSPEKQELMRHIIGLPALADSFAHDADLAREEKFADAVKGLDQPPTIIPAQQ